MDERDIEELFISVLEESGQDTDAVRNVFSTLVHTTLRYRDDVLASRGEVVTVEDARTCLGWLVTALATGNMPQTDNKTRLGLLKLWLEELGKNPSQKPGGYGALDYNMARHAGKPNY
jgi:hypothetical protein